AAAQDEVRVGAEERVARDLLPTLDRFEQERVGTATRDAQESRNGRHHVGEHALGNGHDSALLAELEELLVRMWGCPLGHQFSRTFGAYLGSAGRPARSANSRQISLVPIPRSTISTSRWKSRSEISAVISFGDPFFAATIVSVASSPIFFRILSRPL